LSARSKGQEGVGYDLQGRGKKEKTIPRKETQKTTNKKHPEKTKKIMSQKQTGVQSGFAQRKTNYKTGAVHNVLLERKYRFCGVGDLSFR